MIKVLYYFYVTCGPFSKLIRIICQAFNDKKDIQKFIRPIIKRTPVLVKEVESIVNGYLKQELLKRKAKTLDGV